MGKEDGVKLEQLRGKNGCCGDGGEGGGGGAEAAEGFAKMKDVL